MLSNGQLIISFKEAQLLFSFMSSSNPSPITHCKIFPPDFCNVYVISKGKIQSMRSALRPAPVSSPLRNEIMKQSSIKSEPPEPITPPPSTLKVSDQKAPEPSCRSFDEIDFIRSPFTRRNGKTYGEGSLPDSDLSFVSSGRASLDRLFPYLYENSDSGRNTPTISSSTEMDLNNSFESVNFGRRSTDTGSPPEFSSFSQDSDALSSASQSVDDVEAEMRRLKLELKQTMEMYSTACKEALTANKKAIELQR